MPNTSIWLDLYRKRCAWALAAYDRFVHDLAPELVDALQRNEKITIAVYGATQVGKTTLILELLGINTRSSDEAVRVLRGGQQLGKSATSMPIRYERSLDDSWYIAGNGPLSASEACKTLEDCRKSVEAGEVLDSEVLGIQIPKSLFLQGRGSKEGSDLNIIDIPGINARNGKERELTEQLARRYVAVADVVLLVGRADSLGFLNRQDLQIEALAEWSAQPTRFRIVLTFGFSPDSLRRKFINSKMTVQEVRDILHKEMKTHDYHFPPEFLDNLFLLELGDSIRDLQRSNPDYYHHITRLTSEFRDLLLTNIQHATGPYARLQGAFQLDRIIHARVDGLKSRFEETKQLLDRDKNEVLKDLAAHRADLADADLDAIRSAIEALDQEVNNLIGKRAELERSIGQLSDFDCSRLFSVKLSNDVVEKVSWLQEELQRCELEQRYQCLQLSKYLVREKIVPKWCSDGIETIDYRRDALMEVGSRLDDYVFKKYWRSRNFYSDRDSLDNALKEAAKINGARFKSVAQRSLKDIFSDLDKECGSYFFQKVILQSCVKRLESIAASCKAAQDAIEFKRQEMESALSFANQFESVINKAFLRELNKCQSEIETHPVPAHRFFNILRGRLLLNEVERMYEGKAF